MYSKVYTCNVDSNKFDVMLKEVTHMNDIVQESYVISTKRKENETHEF